MVKVKGEGKFVPLHNMEEYSERLYLYTLQ